MEIISIEHTHDIRGVGESLLLTLTFEMSMFPSKHDYSNVMPRMRFVTLYVCIMLNKSPRHFKDGKVSPIICILIKRFLEYLRKRSLESNREKKKKKIKFYFII